MTIIRQQYLRKEVARSCPIHKLILTYAVDRLMAVGVFSKEEVIDDLNFGAVSDSIRWDYIREFIQEDQKTDLIPLAKAYFNRHKKTDELTNPELFIAQGYGKKTAGYASVVPSNDHLVIQRVKQRKAISDGVSDSFQEYLKRVNAGRAKNGLPPVREQKVLT